MKSFIKDSNIKQFTASDMVAFAARVKNQHHADEVDVEIWHNQRVDRMSNISKAFREEQILRGDHGQ